MGCCNPSRNKSVRNENNSEQTKEISNLRQENSNLRQKNSNLEQKLDNITKEDIGKDKKIDKLNRSRSNSSLGSNGSSSDLSSDSKNGSHLKKINIKFNGANYEIDIKCHYDLLTILKRFKKKFALSPFGKFKYKGEEIGMFTTCRDLGLDEGATIDLE